MTPYLTYHAVIALTDGANTQAWFQAAMNRVKKLPKLEELLSPKEKGPVDLEAKMKAMLKGKKHG